MKKYALFLITSFLYINSFGWNTPTIASPSNGSNQFAGLTFNWNSVAASENYEIQIDTNANFNSPAFQNSVLAYINTSNTNGDTQQFFDDLYFGATYHWRVRAWITGDTSAWSSIRSVNINDFVTKLSPASNSTNWTGLTLDWNPHVGVDFYELQLDTTLNFNSGAFQTVTETYLNANTGNTDTEEFFDNLFFGKTYHWRVRAINAVDTSDWATSTWSFDTRDYVTKLSPANNSTNWTGLTLDWNPHVGVDFYELQLDTTLNFNSAAFQTVTETYLNANTGNTDTEEFFDNLFFGKTYHWRVRAINAVDTSDWATSTWSFDTRDYVTKLSPANNSSNWTGLTLDWNPHVGVDFYELQLDTTLNFNSAAFQTVTETYLNANTGNTDTEEFFDNLYFGKTYHWRVRAINAVDTSDWATSTWSYNTIDYVNLNSPSNLATNQSTLGIGLDWLAHTGVDFYELEWDTTNLFDSPLLLTQLEPYLNSLSSNTDTYENSGALLTNKTYFWRVRAINAVDTSAWTSRIFSTGTSIANPQVPILVAPTDLSIVTGATVNLDWNAATDAIDYEVQYSLSNSFSSYGSAITSSTDFTVSGLINNSTYYWRVRSKNGGFYSNWSTVWSFDFNPITCTSTSSSLTVTACESYISPSGITVTSSTIFNDTINNVAGCDSVITIDLTVNSMSTGTDVVNTCGSHTWIDGNTYTTDNFTATYTLTNVNGCDSIVTLNLTITALNTTTTLSGTTISANQIGANYAWLDCNNGYAVIPGETGQSYSPANNGSYAVQISQNSCLDTSNCTSITTIGFEENNSLNQVFLYPNPSNGVVYFNLGTLESANIRIYRMNGELVHEELNITESIYQINLNEAKGIYFVTVTANAVSKKHKLILH